jgi:hypothetical protein
LQDFHDDLGDFLAHDTLHISDDGGCDASKRLGTVMGFVLR